MIFIGYSINCWPQKKGRKLGVHGIYNPLKKNDLNTKAIKLLDNVF